jgi:type 1 glutamine amidotransferase
MEQTQHATHRCFCRFPPAAFILLLALLISAGAAAPSAAADTNAFGVLVFSKTAGYRHASITNGIAAIRELGSQNGFTVDATEDATVFTATNLARYASVVFLSVIGDVLNPEQESALQSYVEGGGGLAAIHAAVFGPLACEGSWAWYGDMFCCAFTNHSAVVPAMVNLEDAAHAAHAGLPAQWRRTDEWYNFAGTPRGCARVLATVDETSYAGGSMGQDHPVVWCRRVGRGRMWYTAMGHTESSFAEPLFQKHLLGGILLAAGRIEADFTPNAPAAGSLAWNRQAGSLALEQAGKVLWQFNYGATAAKPCFHPLALPGGPVLTRDRPPDHPWHHGLWFSWKFIDGVNYWEEDPKTGAAQGQTSWREPLIETRPDFSARIVMDLSYRPTNGPPVLAEHRVIEVAAPDAGGLLRQDWDMTFRAGDKDVVLDRTHLPEDPGGGQSWGGYAGLGIRFARPLDEVRAINAAGTQGKFVDGRYRGKSPAMDYSGLLDGHEVGIAILDDPANLNSPTPWYAVKDNAMSYFSPAVLTYGPVTLKAGQTLRLRYRLFAHPGRWGAEQLRQAGERFQSE